MKGGIQKIGLRAIRFNLLLTVFIAFLFLSPVLRAAGQGNSNSDNSNRTTPSPSAEPTPLAVSAIVNQAEAVTIRLRAIRSALEKDAEVLGIQDEIAQLGQDFEITESKDLALLNQNPSLEAIRAIASKWQSSSRRLAGWTGTLHEHTVSVDKIVGDLNQMLQTWRLTLDAIKQPESEVDNPVTLSRETSVPPEVVQRVNETISAIEETRRQAQERRAVLLATQTRTSELETRANGVRDEVRAARRRTLTNLFARDEPPIWSTQNDFVSASRLFGDATSSFSAQAVELRAYIAGRSERFILHGIVLLLVIAGLYFARGRVHPFVEKEPKLEKAAQIFSLPVATGLILTILVSTWIYPQAPRLLLSLIGAAALVPVVFLLRRMVERPLFIILNALVVLYFVDLLRDVLVNQPLTARLVFLGELLGAILFLFWLLKSKSLSGRVEAAHYRIFESIRKIIPFVLIILIIAFSANILGFVSLSYLIGNGLLGSAYLALIVYTAVQIIRGLIIFALRVPPLSRTLVVKNNRPIIRERSVKIVRWAAGIIWLLIALDLFSVRQPVIGFFRDLLSWSATVGTITFSLGSVLLFFLMVWIAVLISRLVRFVLEEDVYPRVGLSGGVSYAVSTMLHYSILVVGFMIAVGVVGIDFTRFALIAGAVGIGIGFGLQNIINNFVSGLILLVERPVKVDDVIQIGEHTGSLKQIGLRASVLRKVDGSDVIVPNSQLISEEVINWTMSDEKRRIDIPVGVAYGTDPQVVFDVLNPIAGKYGEILSDPPPKTLFLGLGASSLDFELRVWTGQTDGWVGLRSQLMTDVYAALTSAGIEIPFPQRDLNVRSIDLSIVDELAKPKPEPS